MADVMAMCVMYPTKMLALVLVSSGWYYFSAVWWFVA